MKFSVKRYSFFQNLSGSTLRYSEFFPPEAHEHKQVCNCTVNVLERPEGDPQHIQQSVIAAWHQDDFDIEYNLTNLSFDIKDKNKQRHQLWASHTQKSINMVIPIENYGFNDVFFANLYWGNLIDISRMMNGHSPSRIINLSDINCNDLWVHDCGLGKESVGFLSAHSEIYEWKKIIWMNHLIQDYHERLNNLSTPIEKIYLYCDSNNELKNLIRDLSIVLISLIKNIKLTNLFEVAHQTMLQANEMTDENLAQVREKFEQKKNL